MPASDAYDTSNNQGPGVVWIGPQIVDNGAVGWWHKVSQGASFRDRYYQQVRIAAEDAGLRYRGGYHWLIPGDRVVDQFDNFVGLFGDIRPGESIQLDIEDNRGLPDDMVFEAIDRWADRYGIERLFEYTGRWYMPYNPTGKHVESYLIDRLMARYGDDLQWWLPWYSNVFPASQIPVTPVMWQWAGGAQGDLLEGVGRIDTNEIIDKVRLDIASGYAPGGGGSGPFPQPDPIPDPPLDPDDIPPTPQEDYDMPLFVFSNDPGIPNTPVGAVYEMVAGRRRHVSEAEWFQVLKGVLMNPDGSIPPRASWQPLAYIANGAFLDGIPDYVEATGGSDLAGEPDRQFIIEAVFDVLADVSIHQDGVDGPGSLVFHFVRA